MTLHEKAKQYNIPTTKVVRKDIEYFSSSIKGLIEELNNFLTTHNVEDGEIDKDYSYDTVEYYAIVRVPKSDEELQKEVNQREKLLENQKEIRRKQFEQLKKEFGEE